MVHRKWKETKQQPSMLPGPAVPGCCLVSFYFLWAILSTSTVLFKATTDGSRDGDCIRHPPLVFAAAELRLV